MTARMGKLPVDPATLSRCSPGLITLHHPKFVRLGGDGVPMQAAAKS